MRERIEPERDWRHDAVCRDEDPELFFPLGESGPNLPQIERAKAVCAVCPVRTRCLDEALGTGEDGIWGGTTAEERRRIRQRRQARQGVAA